MSRVKFIDEIDGKKSSPTEIYKRGMATRKRNPTDCFEWSREAAIFGIPDAMQKVIEAYQKGEGAGSNCKKGV